MVRLDIRCPKCAQKRILNLNENEINLRPSGLISINIEKNFTCEHTYIVYLDHNFNVRDYFDLDYSVELPDLILEKKTDPITKESVVSIKHDFDLIKLNVNLNILAILFKAILSKIPCVFVSDKDILYDYIIPFFKLINEDAFEFEFEIISEELYKNSKSKFKKSALVVNSTKVLNSPKKLLDINKLKVEKRIINAFMVELDIQEGLRIIKRHIRIAFDLAGIVSDYVLSHNKDKHIYSKSILDYLEKTHNITIAPHYLDFLIEIVNHYFKIPVKLSMAYYTGVF